MVTVIVAVLALAAVIGALYFVGRGVQVSKEGNPASGETPPRQEQQKVADTAKAPAVGSKGKSGGEGDPQARRRVLHLISCRSSSA